VSTVLVIDDELVIRELVMEILESAGHDVTGADSAERALALLDTNEFDLVVSDVVMPGLSGIELLEAVNAHRASLPVVLVTGAGTYDTLSQALMRGAAGLVTKPFAHKDLQAAVADALERATRSRDELRERLLAPTLASALANAIEARDEYLHGHCDLLAGARPIVRHHHERWNGLGYPDGLAGEEIPLGARIVAVADAIEVMSARQLYRQPRIPAEIVEELVAQRGVQWDPEIVDLAL